MKTQCLWCLWALPKNFNEASFSTTLIYLLYLLVTQMPGCPDLAILWWQTDRRIKPITLPLLHARGIIKSVSSKQTKKYCDHMTCRQHILNTCVPRPWAWSSFILASRLSHIPQTCLWTVLVSCPHAWPEHQTSTVSRYTECVAWNWNILTLGACARVTVVVLCVCTGYIPRFYVSNPVL